jgi:hypothetical protein
MNENRLCPKGWLAFSVTVPAIWTDRRLAMITEIFINGRV